LNKFKKIAEELVHELDEVGISAYIWHIATTGSVYIRFEDNRIGSVRIGDHNGRSKLKYKFNVRSDLKTGFKKWMKDGEIWRYYIHFDIWKDLVDVIIKRSHDVQKFEKGKYSYAIPKFKKK